MKPTVQRVALAAVLGFGIVVSAAAQDRGPGPGGPPGPRGGDRQKMFQDMQHRREQRLHDLLQIKPDQETAFRTYVSSLEQLRPQHGQRTGAGGQGAPGQGAPGQAGPRRGGVPGQQAAPLTTPERLDRSLQRLAEAQQRLQKQAAVVKTFYAAISPEQRKAFDTMGGAGLGGGGFGRHGGMHHRFEGPRFGR
jgi:protein CpxP